MRAALHSRNLPPGWQDKRPVRIAGIEVVLAQELGRAAVRLPVSTASGRGHWGWAFFHRRFVEALNRRMLDARFDYVVDELERAAELAAEARAALAVGDTAKTDALLCEVAGLPETP